MALTNFVDKITVVTAGWLNSIDILWSTIFGEATTKAAARAALTSDSPFNITQGGTNATTQPGALISLFPNTLTRSSNTQLVQNDIGKSIIATGTFAQTFQPSATLGANWIVDYINNGSGIITLTPNGIETIGGKTSFQLNAGSSVHIFTDGSNLFVSSTDLKGVVSSYSSLRALSKTTFSYVTVLGSSTSGDGGGGLYWYNSSDTTSSESLPNIVVATDGARWYLFNNSYYPRTASEVSSSVTPTNYIYPPGDLRRYGADVTGVTNSNNAIVDALASSGGGTGVVTHPGGTIKLTLKVTIPNNITILGGDRTKCIFSFTGNGTAFQNVNGPNSSGYGRVNIKGLTITTTSGASTGAAIEFNAGGFAYYEVSDCRITGGFKYGIILDGCEVTHVHHNIIENSGPANSVNIWLVNGPDRSVGQSTGYTNNITINDNQINGTQYGICDDGGATHKFHDNNINGQGIPMQVCGLVDGFIIDGNEFENGGIQTFGSVGNIDFTNTTYAGGVNVGPCGPGLITGNEFNCGYVGGSTLHFGGASFHQSIVINGNFFGNVLGRTADIDVTKLSNSWCGPNFINANAGQHYTGVHNDVNGNTLLPPPNGYTGNFGQGANVYGDTRFPYQFFGPVIQPRKTITYSASMTIDVSTGTCFEITATNNVAFTILAPSVPAANPVYDGQRITITIINTSGGALGAATWTAGAGGYRMAAWTQPATGFSRSSDFEYNSTSNVWRQISTTTVDVPN